MANLSGSGRRREYESPKLFPDGCAWLVVVAVHCFEEATGEPLWTCGYEVTYPEWVFAPSQASGPTATPTVEAGNVYALVIVAGGKRQLIVWTGESVTSLNPATGETYWREAMVTSNNDAIPTPVVQTNRLLIGILMLKLNADHPAIALHAQASASAPGSATQI